MLEVIVRLKITPINPDFLISSNTIAGELYTNAVFHKARQDPKGYPARHCEPSWADQTNWAVKWANEAIEDHVLRNAINDEVRLLSNVAPPSLDGFEAANISSNVTLGGGGEKASARRVPIT